MTDLVETPVLIIGAGPFGLALSRYLRLAGVQHHVVGSPMSFWRNHMPEGMLLRSDTDWHLDAAEQLTFETYFGAKEAVRPLSLETYLDYATWFREQAGIAVDDDWIERLDVANDSSFVATGRQNSYRAGAVVLALGFEYFRNVPPELASLVPAGRLWHTCDITSPRQFTGRRIALVGGRQSAFESAALLAEAGAASIHLTYRHDTPRFEPSHWEWVTPLMQRFVSEPSWYADLSAAEKQELNARFWAEGRLRLEPWLAPRIDRPEIRLSPGTHIEGMTEEQHGLRITLSNGEQVEADDVILATGYRVDISRIPLLDAGNLLPVLATEEGAPLLNPVLECSVPGLYFTSMAATRSFGSFFAFTVSARVAARLIGESLRSRLG